MRIVEQPLRDDLAAALRATSASQAGGRRSHESGHAAVGDLAGRRACHG